MKPLAAIWIWLVAALLGAVTGALAASLTTGSIRGDIQSVVDRALPLRPVQEQGSASSGEWRKASPAVALFYALKPGPFVERPEDAVARGVVLTSDGWVLAFPNADLSRLLVSVGASSYPVERVVTDPATGAAFVKVSAGNLSVAAFASGAPPVPGSLAFALPASDRVLPLVVSGTDDGSDLPASSDLVRTRFVLDQGVSRAEAGSPLVNDRGELVGLLELSADGHARAIPLPFILPAFSTLLKTGAVVRPTIGLNTLDLSRVRHADASLARGHDRGALVFGPNAVKPGSAAAAAGVRPGDLILEVDGAPLDATRSFAQAIAPFGKGDSFTLTVDRLGERRAISIQL